MPVLWFQNNNIIYNIMVLYLKMALQPIFESQSHVYINSVGETHLYISRHFYRK